MVLVNPIPGRLRNALPGPLCGRARADCSKGIVVGGFSQGAGELGANLDWLTGFAQH